MQRDLPRARCWLQVDLAAVAHNLRLAQSMLRPDATLIAVLKADAYGLGSLPMARMLRRHGVNHFAVACLDEAFALREAVPDGWILCMGETLEGALEPAVAAGIRLTVGSWESAARVSRAAAQQGCTAYVHLKVDTGLHRIGAAPKEAAALGERIALLPNICLEGVYTHLALHNKASDEAQHAAFLAVLADLRRREIPVPMAHVLDSIGLVRYPAWQHQAVRVGALLWGNAPRGFQRAEEVRPTVRFCARVARVCLVPAGQYIGYDDDHPLERDTLVATLTAGYADGYPRSMSGIGAVEIREKRARCLGLICMDQMMVDVTDIPGVQPGEEAVLLGDGISLTEYARTGNLNRNECTAVIGKRVPRIYME